MGADAASQGFCCLPRLAGHADCPCPCRPTLLWCSPASCAALLRHPSTALVLAVGGGAEALRARPGTMDLVLRRRKGFVRQALQAGAALVPVIGACLLLPPGMLASPFSFSALQQLPSSPPPAGMPLHGACVPTRRPPPPRRNTQPTLA